MTKIFTQDVTPVNETNMNKLAAADASANYQCAAWGLQIRYTGAVWEAVATAGATAQIANVALAWNATDNRLEIDLTSVTNPFVAGQLPIAVTTPYDSAAGAASTFYEPAVQVFSNVLTYVRFYDKGGTTLQTSQGTNMRFYILWFGRIS